MFRNALVLNSKLSTWTKIGRGRAPVTCKSKARTPPKNLGTTQTRSTSEPSPARTSSRIKSRKMACCRPICVGPDPSASTGRTSGCAATNTLICCTTSRTTQMFSGCRCLPRKNTPRTSTSSLKVSLRDHIFFTDGQVYFVRANSIGSDFGFPRLGIKKHYKWKKMNFTTDLPKRNPLVSYIVASAVRCEKFFPPGSKGGPVYRMHAVILKLKPGQAVGMTPSNPFNL